MAYHGYESAYRYRRYRRPARKRKIFAVVFSLAALIAVVIYFQKNVSGILFSLSEASVHALTVQAANEAVSETLAWNTIDYDKLVEVTRDGEGRILSLEANMQALNLFARQTATVAMSKLSVACEGGVRVPLGAFTGIEVLAGFGPKVTFQIIPVGTVLCDFFSDFRTAGLNQTLHSIYLVVTATVSIVMPSETREVSSETQVLVCESVIVGEVPDAYFGNGLFGGAD